MRNMGQMYEPQPIRNVHRVCIHTLISCWGSLKKGALCISLWCQAHKHSAERKEEEGQPAPSNTFQLHFDLALRWLLSFLSVIQILDAYEQKRCAAQHLRNMVHKQITFKTIWSRKLQQCILSVLSD